VALGRIETILAEVGATLADIAIATVCLTDPTHFAEFNSGWVEKFGDHRPARATIPSQLLPEGLVVEIPAIALLPS
jgi:2-iminobutanoate/2-iminopropanoate deaminase